MADRVDKRVGVTVALEPDAQLMLRVKDGDTYSFELLLGKYRRPVVNYLYRMVQNQAVAEELTQEVFLRVYRARTNYEPTAKFTTWLFRITTHLALNNLRDRKGEQRQQSLDVVRRAIASLPEKQRAAVLMHKYEELNYSQIAGALSCSVSAVKSLLFRAYETLRERLVHLAEDRRQRAR